LSNPEDWTLRYIKTYLYLFYIVQRIQNSFEPINMTVGLTPAGISDC